MEVIITDMGDYMGPDESILRSMTAKIDSEAAGQAKAKLLVSIIKLLVDVKVTRLLAECNPSPDENTNLEAELESLQRAVKVMYGWDALVEDDYKVFRRMLDANATLVQR